MKKIAIFLFFAFLTPLTHAQIKMGAECMEQYLPLLKGKKVAVCGNHTSMVYNTHLVDTLLSSGVNVVAIFCPEHGFRGEAEAGAHIKSSVDAKTGLPIISLYGSNRKPKAEQLAGIDIILFDIQDVGCRFYTYISTLHYVMEAAAENHVIVAILDRPNPNGYFVDGPVLEPKYKSFIGMHPVPVVHGMTIAEYGMMINAEGWLSTGPLSCDLRLFPMEGYNHSMRYHLPYAPSPNLQSDEAIYLYPSLCLFEGTLISVGRGTDKPFEVYGHPELTGGDYYFTPQPIRGVSENPPLKGQRCRGYQLTDWARARYDSTNSFSLEFLMNAYRQFPRKSAFFERAEVFDKLAGTATLRQQIIAGKTEQEIRDSWQPELDSFKAKRALYLLYPLNDTTPKQPNDIYPEEIIEHDN